MHNMDKYSTGLPGLDEILDYLHLGDNVVWQFNHIEDYIHFVAPFVDQGIKEARNIIYFRFGEHQEIVAPCPQVKRFQLDAGIGFETFSSRIYSIATAEGTGAYYVFDCLSDLLSAWSNDLMIGNFFRVTCPYLFELDTIAYFGILKGRNSHQTLNRIRETTQLLLDVYRYETNLYVHPLKVWNRYSKTMFLPHLEYHGNFLPLTSSMETTRLLSQVQPFGSDSAGLKLDYWDKVFLRAREKWEDAAQTGNEARDVMDPLIDQLCRMIIGREKRVLDLAKKYFTLKDLLDIRQRLIGSGYIGGKAVGMLIARKILLAREEQKWHEILEPHDSFYVGSDVYYTYLVEKDCWKLRMKQKEEDHYFTAAAEIQERILEGELPALIKEQFQQMLEYFGQSPIIIRSSSLLEDGFGNAFAGKYDSVFCVNQGNPQERYQVFQDAVKTVFASTMSQDALIYRSQRGLARCDEQMALLVQRVSGSYHSRYFFPDLAGVAMSHNPYIWNQELDPGAGMARLVVGLGTRAVDRVEDDYPRVLALDKPLLRPLSTPEEIKRFSQHWVDVLDTVKNDIDTVSVDQIALPSNRPSCWNLLADYDREGSQKLRELNYPHQDIWTLSLHNLLRQTPLAALLRNMLKTIEDAYAYPVDTEFTANFTPEGTLQLNLLQCRPLQTHLKSIKPQGTREVKEENIFLATRGNFMGPSVYEKMRYIIYLRAEDYLSLNTQDKYQAARIIGMLNRVVGNQKSHPSVLIGPGRWGTSTPSLGVPVSFAEISHIRLLVEVAYQEKGLMPELSYGTHFFQDLIETEIIYAAIFPEKEGVRFNTHFLDASPNHLGQELPQWKEWEKVIKWIDLEQNHQELYLDINLEQRELSLYYEDEPGANRGIRRQSQ